MPLLDLLTGWQDNSHFEKSDFSRAQLSLLHWNTRLYALFYMGFIVYFVMSIRRYTPVEIGLIIGSSSLIGGICFCVRPRIVARQGKH